VAEQISVDRRFGFGANWRDFAEDIDSGRILVAETSLREMLGTESLDGRNFLDVGCGSGLFSLAAVKLGAAPVHSFDFDSESTATATLLKDREAPTADWTIESGDVLDAGFMTSLGTYDVVYAWGVVHHTGSMWHALANTCDRVAPNGMLFVSIYNDQGRKSRRWRAVKKLYNGLPLVLRTPYVAVVMSPWEIRRLGRAILRRRPGDYVRGWTEPRERGMSYWHDLIDWVGGYPFEVAKPEEVFHFCRDRGFELMELKTVGGGLGCNQFVFQSEARRERSSGDAT
jgi:SAM-dependent methyltransferase